MKKAIGVILVLALAITLSAFAADKEQAKTEEKGMMQRGMMQGGGMMGGGMGMMGGKAGRSMCSMMMQSMAMGKSMVATDDGGVVVMVGNKLYKYDKNLELKKEVEIKMDMATMENMMKRAKGMCPNWQEREEQGPPEKEEE